MFNNKNADKRIEAVQGIDQYLDTLTQTLDKRMKYINLLERKALEAKPMTAQNWALLYPKSSAAYKEAGEPVPFGLEAFEAKVNQIRNLHNVLVQLSDQLVVGRKPKNIDLLLGASKQMSEYLVDKATLDQKGISGEDWLFTLKKISVKDFMDTIKTPKDITAMNDLAANGKLYGYINGQKFQIEAQYTAAQNRIKQAASHDKEALRNDYAIMLTVSALKTTKIHVADMTVADFEKYTEKMYEKNGFQEMMSTRTSEALYNFATTGNGLGLAMEEQKASAEFHKREDGKKKSQEQQKGMSNQKDKSMNP